MQQLRCSCRRFLIVVGLTILTVSYTFLGAYIFRAVDENELNSKQQKVLFEVDKIKNETIETILFEVTPGLRVIDRDILWQFVQENIDDLTTKLLDTYEDGKMFPKKEFSFEESLLFSFSLLTTIGSGQSEMILKTDSAKGIVFPYAAVGIPLMLVWLMMLGTCFAHNIILIYNRVCCFWCNRRKSYSSSKQDDDEPGCCTTGELDNIGAPFFAILLLLLIWIVLGTVGLVYCLEESWGYLDAALYVFKTLTTIGYTSKNPQFSITSEDDKLIKFILYVLYIWFGLILVAALIRMVFLIIDKFFRSKNQDNDEVTY